MRYWFLTNTCYGTWLPGDSRGFVGHVWEHIEEDDPADLRVSHNSAGADYDKDMPGLERESRARMLGEPTYLTESQARMVVEQFQETARFRKWELIAAAVMFNHFHILVGVEGDPDPGKLLGDFKSWASRRLNEHFGTRDPGHWWTSCGSKRKVCDTAGVIAVARYILFRQSDPLVTWSRKLGYNPRNPEASGTTE